MAFVQLVCATCGSSLHLPRHAPDGARAQMSKSEIRDYAKGWGEGWPTSGRFFTPAEQDMLGQLFSHCGCGGNLYPEGHKRARLRCPECASPDVAQGPDLAEFD